MLLLVGVICVGMVLLVLTVRETWRAEQRRVVTERRMLRDLLREQQSREWWASK